MHFLKKGQKIRAWVDPPLIRAMPEQNVFFSLRLPLQNHQIIENSLGVTCDGRTDGQTWLYGERRGVFYL